MKFYGKLVISVSIIGVFFLNSNCAAGPGRTTPPFYQAYDDYGNPCASSSCDRFNNRGYFQRPGYPDYYFKERPNHYDDHADGLHVPTSRYIRWPR